MAAISKIDITTFLISDSSNETTNGLPRTFSDVMSDSKALEYFGQFMKTRSAVSLINFCTDVKFFKVTYFFKLICFDRGKDQ